MKEEKGAEFGLPQTGRIRGHLWNRYSVMGHDGDHTTFEMMTSINVREIQWDNQEWTIQRHWQIHGSVASLLAATLY
jgi:hypothetical protein